mgnify:CR=1 FL=1
MDIKELQSGIELTLEQTVKKSDTAAAYGSGSLDVLATPAMIALMENTSLKLVKDKLPDGYDTVGTHVDIKHIKATPLGGKVTCKSRLTAVEGRKLTFEVTAQDEKGPIGKGTHKRYIIDRASFLNSL